MGSGESAVGSAVASGVASTVGSAVFSGVTSGVTSTVGSAVASAVGSAVFHPANRDLGPQLVTQYLVFLCDTHPYIVCSACFSVSIETVTTTVCQQHAATPSRG